MPHIASVKIYQVRNIADFEFRLSPIGEDKLSHLIVTGPNGSGKTGLLLALREEIEAASHGTVTRRSRADLTKELEEHRNLTRPEISKMRMHTSVEKIKRLEQEIREQQLHLSWTVDADNVSAEGQDQQPMFVFFDAFRSLTIGDVPGPNRASNQALRDAQPTVSSSLLQEMVNMKTEQAYAKLEGDAKAESALALWFEKFEEYLRTLFDDPELRMEFVRDRFDFRLIRGRGYEFSFRTLSHGYASTLQIVSELLLRREIIRRSAKGPTFEPSGIVIIDEIENHLHIRLQEIILPFLTSLFPRLQFIVATHSPAVVSSVSDAIVVDLGSKKSIESKDLVGKRYGTLMTGHFGVPSEIDKESTDELSEFRKLVGGVSLSADQARRRDELATRLTAKSQWLALEVWNLLNLAEGAQKE